jgi:hypothetical protein
VIELPLTVADHLIFGVPFDSISAFTTELREYRSGHCYGRSKDRKRRTSGPRTVT